MMKSKLFYTITKRSYYDFVRQSIPMPPLERIQFTHFTFSKVTRYHGTIRTSSYAPVICEATVGMRH